MGRLSDLLRHPSSCQVVGENSAATAPPARTTTARRWENDNSAGMEGIADVSCPSLSTARRSANKSSRRLRVPDDQRGRTWSAKHLTTLCHRRLQVIYCRSVVLRSRWQQRRLPHRSRMATAPVPRPLGLSRCRSTSKTGQGLGFLNICRYRLATHLTPRRWCGRWWSSCRCRGSEAGGRRRAGQVRERRIGEVAVWPQPPQRPVAARCRGTSLSEAR